MCKPPILGDINTYVDSDNEAWPNCLGHFGVGKYNDNGQRLLELCSDHELCITNTFFGVKPHHRVSWRHPRSKHWHQLDLILTGRTHLKNFLVTRTYHSADHSLVYCRLTFQTKKFHHTKQEGKSGIDVSKTKHFDRSAEFTVFFLSSTEQWESVKNATRSAVLSAFGKKKGTRQNDWYDSSSARLEPLIETKRTALKAYKDDGATESLNARMSARSGVQKEIRACINEYWIDLCRTIQQTADNVKDMYNGIKKATGPSVNKAAPLKSNSGEVITDKA